MAVTPLMQQYYEIKKQNPGCILFFRMGDFFELFEDDAVIASKILGLTLTSRNNGASGATPLCGFPHHAADRYVPKMVAAGYRIAICEQVEDPKLAKGIVKRDIVEQDPHEHGIRKALNLGHTIGHAFESFAMRKGNPILHGYAVAYGIVCELYLSAVKTAFPTEKMRQTVAFIRENYGQMDITCDDYPELLALMRHDKKNTAGTINFTLLADIGDIRINQTATEEEIKEALDFYREG